MSFAALQNTPTTLNSLNPPPLAPASSSTRPFSSSHPPPSREAYHAQHPSASASIPSSQRPSRSQGGNGNSSSIAGQNSPMSSRAAVLSSPARASPDHQPPSSSSDRRRQMAAAVPPRTSSTQHNSTASTGSRRAVYESERGTTGSPRRAQPDPNGVTDPGPSSASRSRRTANYSNPPHDPSHRSTATRDSRPGGSSTSMPVRSHPASSSHSASKGPSREASEILNSVLISQPEVDIQREKERLALAQPHQTPGDDDAIPQATTDEPRRGGRSRHDHSKREKHTKFGEYILGNTIGEGEFGKVKLGWKQEGGVQVAIKLIKKDQLGSNPSRMAKIMREVAILKQLTHPNIVRLHKMEESERHYGIILEYASGGELFDYILNHRYLKDNAARRLFAQLVSGVGYLHKKGIVHRDLKLENLLLDRNRNIIITDFGFANTFDPNEELTEEEETKLSEREWVKSMNLDKVKPNGTRKADLMQTSCGSPCYAAPELVVSDSLYTGRKVDVWSCGVILYAMLAGYLPFDDDPANPEGDNINLLYKYIVNTPLTFPEYVTPHARDLLRRILVPNPRRRADLFEVARHSWLSDYAHIVELITSSTTTPSEIQNTTVATDDESETPGLARSASVRESSKKASAAPPPVGGLVSKQGTLDAEAAEAAAYARQQKDAKRRTVQVEYVAPTTQTTRGDAAPRGHQSQAAGKTRARSGSQGPVGVPDYSGGPVSPQDKPLPRDPPVSKDAYAKSSAASRRPPSSHHNNTASARSHHHRDGARAVSEYPYTSSSGTGHGAGPRPATGGSMKSTGSVGMGATARASYGQPLPPEVADTNAHGRIQQPKSSAGSFGVSSPASPEPRDPDYGRPSISAASKAGGGGRASAMAREAGDEYRNGNEGGKGHKRSNTIGEISGKIFGRSGSIFGGKGRKRGDQQPTGEKPKRYPPVSMINAMPGADEQPPRQSVDSKPSRRSFTMALGKKRSGSISGSQTSQDRHSRRFSLLPGGFSLKAIGIGKDSPPPPPPLDSQQDLPISEPGGGDHDRERERDRSRYDPYTLDNDAGGREHVEASTLDGMYAQLQDPVPAEYQPAPDQRFAPGDYGNQSSVGRGYLSTNDPRSSVAGSADNVGRPAGSAPHAQNTSTPPPPSDEARRTASAGRQNRGVLQKNRRFVDAWDTDESSRTHDHSGSSGPARKVMDFFRRIGKDRSSIDR